MVKKIKQKKIEEIVSDNCEKIINVEAVKLECWYGSEFDAYPDGQFIFDFSSDKCCKEWVTENLDVKKDNKMEEDKFIRLCNSGKSWECPICHAIMYESDKDKHIQEEIKETQDILGILEDLQK
jgi:hypothetical protein